MGRQLFTIGITIILCGMCILPIISKNVIAEQWITISSPSGGTYYKGDMLSINWNTYGAGSYVTIELYKEDYYYSTVAVNVGNYGYYSYSIPESASSSSSYRIKITSASNSSIYGYSNYFSIYGQFISVTSPSDGDTWFKGDTYTINWDSENVGDLVKIGYEIGYNHYEITSSTYNDGSHDWTIEISPTQYCRVYVTSLSYPHVSEYSEYFTIDERYTVVNYPSNGDRWYTKETYTITWDSKNAGGYVAIELYERGNLYSTITSNTINDGSYSWTIPSNMDKKSNYQIKIKSILFSNVDGVSGDFSIDERTVFIGSPSGGETWFKGEIYPINWESEDAGKYVDIELYEDGEYHSTIASNTENDGNYEWRIPEDFTSGSEYSVKITSTYYDNVYEYSSGYVAIEEDLMKHWSGIIFLFLVIMIILTVVLVVIKKKKIKTPKLSKSHKQTSEISEVKREMQPEKISPEEFDRIWERT